MLAQALAPFYLRRFARVVTLFTDQAPQRSDAEGISRVNVMDVSECTRWAEEIVLGHPEAMLVLINCAGVNYNAMAHRAEALEWLKVLEVNVAGVFNVTRSFLPFMRSAGRGKIINIGSVVAKKTVRGTSAYAASKAALRALCRTIALENSSLGICVNNLNLGYFDLGMIGEIPETQLANIISEIPMGRIGDPNEIVHAIDFLIAANYMTGEELELNGGALL